MLNLIEELQAAAVLLRFGLASPDEVAQTLDALSYNIRNGTELRLPDNVCLVWSDRP